MRVQSLWRFPVKSMQGESCDELEIHPGGVRGDRSFGVLDLESGTIISAKRDGRLLQAEASFMSGELTVTLPGAQELDQGQALDENLTRWLGRPVRLVEAATFDTPTFEGHEDFERDDSALVRWEGRRGSFVDDSPLHLITTGDMDQLIDERPELQWNLRRFRPNFLVQGEAGSLRSSASGRLRIGDVEIHVYKACTRCVMTTRAQPGDLERQLDILRHVSKVHGNIVGDRASVLTSGMVRVGDAVAVAD